MLSLIIIINLWIHYNDNNNISKNLLQEKQSYPSNYILYFKILSLECVMNFWGQLYSIRKSKSTILIPHCCTGLINKPVLVKRKPLQHHQCISCRNFYIFPWWLRLAMYHLHHAFPIYESANNAVHTVQSVRAGQTTESNNSFHEVMFPDLVAYTSFFC